MQGFVVNNAYIALNCRLRNLQHVRVWIILSAKRDIFMMTFWLGDTDVSVVNVCDSGGLKMSPCIFARICWILTANMSFKYVF